MKNLIIIICLLILISGCATYRGQQSLAENQGSLAESQVAIAEYLHMIRNDILLLQLMIINMDKYQPTSGLSFTPEITIFRGDGVVVWREIKNKED